MKCAEERRRLLYRRAEELKKKRDRQILSLSVGAGGLLFAALLGAGTLLQNDQPAGLTLSLTGSYTGSSLLSESAGAYVLVAVLAFMAGVVITALCMKKRKDGRSD